MSVSIRREVRPSSGHSVGSPGGNNGTRKRSTNGTSLASTRIIPKTSTMEALPPEEAFVEEAFSRVGSSSSSSSYNNNNNSCSSSSSSSATNGKRGQENTFLTMADEQESTKKELGEESPENIKNRLEAITVSQDALRAELEGYMNDMKGKIDMGEEFQSKVACEESTWKEQFTLQSDTAAEALKKDQVLKQKIDKGKRKISKLDARLEELEKKLVSINAKPVKKEDEEDFRVEKQGTALDDIVEEEQATDIVPYINDLDEQSNDMDCEEKATEPLDDKDSKQKKKKKSSSSRKGKLSSKKKIGHVKRNIELANDGQVNSTSLTAEEESRVEALLLVEDQDDTELGEVTMEALVPYRESESSQVDHSLQQLVGPEEWETKSLYFLEDHEHDEFEYDDEEDEDDAQTVSSRVGPLLTARSSSKMSLFSSTSASSKRAILLDLQAQRENQTRLKQIDDALKHLECSTLLSNSSSQEDSSNFNSELAELIRESEYHIKQTNIGIAPRNQINDLLTQLLSGNKK